MDKDNFISVLLEKIDALTLRLDQAEREIVALKAENSELKARLSSNSSNSSKPPSSDGYTKKPALSKSFKGKKGGQTGHKGNTLQQSLNPDQTVACKPAICTCGHAFLDQEMKLSEKRQVFDLPQPKLEVTEYQIYKGICPDCGLSHKGQAPAGVNSPVQYGNNVKALVVLLNVQYKLPFKKIQLLFGDLFSCPINESSVYSAALQCYQDLDQSEQIIKSKVTQNGVVHVDETGVRVGGLLRWLHTASTNLCTYLFVHDKRGEKALQSDKSILNNFTGWLIHDCWSSYFKFTGAKHGLCGAHILRELQALVETGECKWAKTFKTFLMQVYEMPFQQRVIKRQQIISRYMRICQLGLLAEPPPTKAPEKRGRYKRTKARNLVERLMREQDAVLAFAFNEEVPFTNNMAERDIRPVKVKQKISNCFRSFKGAEIFARIEGFVSTSRKQKRNVFSELCHTFDGYNFVTEGVAK
ncbi:MAG: IS66 family transposase [Lentimicrobium sp.]